MLGQVRLIEETTTVIPALPLNIPLGETALTTRLASFEADDDGREWVC